MITFRLLGRGDHGYIFAPKNACEFLKSVNSKIFNIISRTHRVIYVEAEHNLQDIEAILKESIDGSFEYKIRRII